MNRIKKLEREDRNEWKQMRKASVLQWMMQADEGKEEDP